MDVRVPSSNNIISNLQYRVIVRVERIKYKIRDACSEQIISEHTSHVETGFLAADVSTTGKIDGEGGLTYSTPGPRLARSSWQIFMASPRVHFGHEDVQFDAGVEESHSTQLLSWGWHGVLYDQSKYRGN